MKHPVSKQQLVLYVAEELPETAIGKIERHLKRCAKCRGEVEDLRKMHAFVRAGSPQPDERTLTSWRRDVVRAIRQEEPKRAAFSVIREFFGFTDRSLVRPALSLLAVGCLAFVIGFTVAWNDVSESELFSPIAYDPYGTPQQSNDLGDAQVVNVDILSRNDATGEIEFEFEAMFRSRVRGNMADPAIQGILARALISSQNPGVRLRAVNAFSESIPEERMPRKTKNIIKASLISAVKYDENQGVRLEALKALKGFMPDTLVTSAIVYVLLHDRTAAMKIAAISSLDLSSAKDARERDQLAEILKDRSLNDENNYIRIKAKAALQEINP